MFDDPGIICALTPWSFFWTEPWHKVTNMQLGQSIGFWPCVRDCVDLISLRLRVRVVAELPLDPVRQGGLLQE